MDAASTPAGDPVARLLSGYAPPPGVVDEMIDAHGGVRPVWRRLLEHFAKWSPEEAAQRFARGDQYLRDAGVYFRQYDTSGSSQRAWPMRHLPLLVEEAEWRGIETALVHRAGVLEALAADLYGPNRLVSEGLLPAGLIAASPEWLRPLVGVPPRHGRYLHFIAFDIGRGPDRAWWVLGDRTQAPSGAGFALENRFAAARIFADLYGEAHVHRLAGFFQAFRDALLDMRDDGASRVGILTPGPLNDTYFEHAYIARYLGFVLLESEDLVVDDGRVMVRTISGLRPIDVLWRRLDAAYADPLELRADSQIGTPGLVGAMRRGSATLVNALGAGVIETRALMAFMPAISRALTGENLKMPNIATWWCGEPDARKTVVREMDAMMIGRALSTRLPYDYDEATVLGASFRGAARGNFERWLERDGSKLVGQEAVTLSTTPVYQDGRLEPRPVSLRVFMARTRDGWRMMAGGFARIGQSMDPTAIAMQRGGGAADVWVISPEPVPPVSMLPAADAPYRRSPPETLPSRAAENLYWMGRYVERAEDMIRLLRAYHSRLNETPEPKPPLLTLVARELEAMDVEPDEPMPKGLRGTLDAAFASASAVRDRFSTDGWMALDDLNTTAQRLTQTVTAGDDAARAMGVLLRKINGFSGLVHENMYRFNGWRFLSIGRGIERAMNMSHALAIFADAKAPPGALDLAIEIGDSVMSHRRRHAFEASTATVLDLLALDRRNPRSVLFQLTEIRDQIAWLPDADVNGQLSDLARAALRVQSELAVRLPESLDPPILLTLADDIGRLSELLYAAYMR